MSELRSFRWTRGHQGRSRPVQAFAPSAAEKTSVSLLAFMATPCLHWAE